MTAENRLLTTGEVAKQLRVHRKTVNHWVAAGKLNSIKTPGGTPRFAESEIRALLGEHSPSTRENFLTTGEIARWFKVDPYTVIRWADNGKLSSFTTPGGHRRFRESEVQALFRRKRDGT